MILLWTIIGIAVAYCIARYNASNTLFWSLIVSFLLGFTATKAISSSFEKKSSIGQFQANATQVDSTTAPNTVTLLQVQTGCAYKKVTDSATVSQPSLETSSIDATSEVLGETQDQPQKNLLKPPERSHYFFDTS